MPGLSTTCGLSLLLVVFLAPRISHRFLQFPPSTKPTFQIPTHGGNSGMSTAKFHCYYYCTNFTKPGITQSWKFWCGGIVDFDLLTLPKIWISFQIVNNPHKHWFVVPCLQYTLFKSASPSSMKLNTVKGIPWLPQVKKKSRKNKLL